MEIQRKTTIITKLNCLYLSIRQPLNKYLYQQHQLYLSIFVFVYLLGHYQLIVQDQKTNILIFITILSFSIIQKANYYYYYIAVLKISNPIVNLISILYGISNINEPYKVYMFIFTISYSFKSLDPQFIRIYQTISAFLICWQIYQNLILNSISENRKYLFVFSFIGMLNISEQLQKFVSMPHFYIFELTILTLAGILSYLLFQNRIKNLNKKQQRQISNPRILKFKIQLLQSDIKECIKKFKEHMIDCCETDCFCQKYRRQTQQLNQSQIIEIKSKFINFEFLNALEVNVKSREDKLYLIKQYSKFLLQTKQSIKCAKIASLVCQTQNSYFQKVLSWRILYGLKEYIQRCNYFIKVNKKFQVIFMKDSYEGFMKKQIYQILSLKISFWNQLCRPEARLKQLQILSKQIIQTTQHLHYIYQTKIRPAQIQTLYFTASILYSAYLTLTTNYSEYADNILKNIQETMSSITIKTMVNVMGMRLNLYEDNQGCSNMLKITNLSTTLATELKKQKNNLLNSCFDSIIPNYFKDIHIDRFNKWIQQSEFKKQISQLFKYPLELPFKIDAKKVYISYVEIRLCIDFTQNQICFQAILFQNERNNIRFMIDLDGKSLYSQENKQKSIIYFPEVLHQIKQIKQKYILQNIAQASEVDIQAFDNSYRVIFTFLFEKALVNAGKKPVMLVKIQDQNVKDAKMIKTQQFLRTQNTNSRKNNNNLRAIAQNQSQSSIQSRKDAVQNIVLILADGKVWGKNQVTFRVFLAFIFILTIVILLIHYQIAQITLSSTPFYSLIVGNDIITYITGCFNMHQDLQLYQKGDPQIQGLIKKALFHDNIQEQLYSRMENYSKSLHTKLNTYMIGSTDCITKWRNQKFEQKLEIAICNKTLLSSYQFTIHNVIIRTIVDLSYLKKYDYDQTLMKRVLIQDLLPKLDKIQNESYQILDEAEQKNKVNMIIITIAIILIMITVIGPYIKLTKSKKKQNLQVYNLLTDLNSTIIIKQISKLEKIKQTIFIQKSIKPDRQVSFKKKQKRRQNSSLMRNFMASIIPISCNNIENVSHLNVPNNNKQTNIRIRPADLVFQGTPMNPQKLNKIQLLFCCFMLLFSLLIVGIMLLNIQGLKSYDFFKQKLRFHLNQIKSDNYQLLAGKMFFDKYQLNNQIQFFDLNLKQFLEQSIQQQYQNQINRYNGTQEAYIRKCIQNRLICQQNYSYPILRGIIKKSIYDTYNEKNKIIISQQKSQNYAPSLDLNQIRGQLFLGQQAMNKIFEISSEFIQNIISQTQKIKTHTQIKSKTVYILFSILLVLFLGYCIFLSRIMKKSYLNSLVVLSFMNKEMVFRNKRVESFISRLLRQYR